ncbi:MAG: serine hydrolase [Pseudomonadota bacterium]
MLSRIRHTASALAILISSLLLALAAQAEGRDVSSLKAMEDEALIVELWQSGGELSDVFAASFLQAVTPQQIKAIMAPMLADLGAAQTVLRLSDGEFELRTATHRVPVFLSRNGDGLIEGLLIRPARKLEVDQASTLQAFMQMGSRISLLATTDGQTVAEINPDEKLAVGSAFKLAVLVELHDRIETGEFDWAQVVELEQKHRSLPSGIMQDWPAGTPVTLQTAAQMMIAISDNTATDLLIDVLGRDALERRTGNVPLITTRELFHIRADADLSNRYLQADDLERKRALLATLTEKRNPGVTDIEPFSLDHPAEWYFSASELCGILKDVADLPVMTAEAGPLSRSEWQRIAFKGGSEGGVLNMTAQFSGEDGRTHCLAVTVNSERPIDANRFTSAFVDFAGTLGAL